MHILVCTWVECELGCELITPDVSVSDILHMQVFAGVFPMDSSEYLPLRTAVEKLTLNDSSVKVHPDSSVALGQGWRLGFLGLLHMDVFRQRLEEVCI